MKAVYQYPTCREFFRAVLADRIGRRPGYSLRSLARSVDVSPTQLCQVLNGRKRMSPTSALRVGKKLGLPTREQTYLTLLAQYELETDPAGRAEIHSRIEGLRPDATHDVDADSFRVIANWYHFPILQMTYLDDCDLSAVSISRRLGISELEAGEAVDRLQRLGLLAKDARGRWKSANARVVVGASERNDAIRQFHRQMLIRAIGSLETQTPDQKKIGSETFAGDPEQLSEANEILEETFNRILALFGKGKKKTRIYHLGIQLFELTTPVGRRVR